MAVPGGLFSHNLSTVTSITQRAKKSSLLIIIVQHGMMVITAVFGFFLQLPHKDVSLFNIAGYMVKAPACDELPHGSNCWYRCHAATQMHVRTPTYAHTHTHRHPSPHPLLLWNLSPRQRYVVVMEVVDEDDDDIGDDGYEQDCA